MIRLEKKNYNTMLTEKLQKYQHYHQLLEPIKMIINIIIKKYLKKQLKKDLMEKYTGPILESKDMHIIFQRTGKNG